MKTVATRIALLLVTFAVTFGTVIAPAEAATTNAPTGTVANTITSKAGVKSITKSMYGEIGYASVGCGLNKSVTAILKATKAKGNVSLQLAKQVIKQANKGGKGFCKAAVVIAASAADMWLTWYATGVGSGKSHVYIKQVLYEYKNQFAPDHFEVYRYIGKDRKHTTKFHFYV